MVKLATKHIDSIVDGIEIGSLDDAGYAGFVQEITIATAVSAFQPLYNSGSFQYSPANATSESTGDAKCIALEGASSGTIKALFWGKVRNDTWNWSNGAVFIDTSAGTLTQTAPSSTGNVVKEVGTAIDADTVLFDFSKWPIVLS